MTTVKFKLGNEISEANTNGVDAATYAENVRLALVERGDIDANAKMVLENGVYTFVPQHGMAG